MTSEVKHSLQFLFSTLQYFVESGMADVTPFSFPGNFPNTR